MLVAANNIVNEMIEVKRAGATSAFDEGCRTVWFFTQYTRIAKKGIYDTL